MDEIRLVVTTQEALRALVRDEIAAASKNKEAKHEDWMSADDVAAMLGYRRTYVAELVRRHGLPSHQPGGRGGRRMFRRADVEAWASARKGTR